MAQSIYETLDSLVTETSVPAIGKMVEHTIPREALPTSEEFENEEKLLAWCRQAGVLHACLQAGIQKRLIDIRATFKAVKKDEVWTYEKGQKAVDDSKWETTDRPKVKKTPEQIAMEYLASLNEDQKKAFMKKANQ